MNLYIDESGSLTNHLPKEKNFIIALVHVKDKKQLARAYKRFISSKHQDLLRQDQKSRQAKMFRQGKFQELKGSQLDPTLKKEFVRFFSQKKSFDLYYIRVYNHQLPARFFQDGNASFNYFIRQALGYFYQSRRWPQEPCWLELDNRNEKIENQNFLSAYLNTELILKDLAPGPFEVEYFNSAKNRFVQIADVLANLYYSHLQTHNYQAELDLLQEKQILKYIYEFPKNSSCQIPSHSDHKQKKKP